jgi:hypothetical protein
MEDDLIPLMGFGQAITDAFMDRLDTSISEKLYFFLIDYLDWFGQTEPTLIYILS